MNYFDLINLDNILKWRNHLHMHPELSFKEYKTSQYIFDILSTFEGLEVSRPTKTSVVAILDTKREGKTIALRADIDALPMDEHSGVEYQSVEQGIMHSCGHDVHTAMLLGAAEALVQMKDDLCGKIKFIFQHAEELLPGGARDLVAAGVIKDVDEIYGQHVFGGFPLGAISTKKGVLTASADTFEISLEGKGSHGSTPELSIDLVVVGSEIVNALQTIVSRIVPSSIQSVVTVGQFNIGTAPNIIAQTGFLSGTVRTVDKDIRDLIETKLKKIVNNICEMHGAKVEINYIRGYSSVFNDENAYNLAVNSAKKVVGEQGYKDMPIPLMGGEDFSAYTNEIPGCFLMLGGGDDEGYQYFNHHPKFRIHDQALLVGAKLHVQIILDILKK